MNSIAFRALFTGLILLSAGCSTLPRGASFPRQESHAITPDTNIVGHVLQSVTLKDELSAYQMLTNGVDGLAARLELINTAERSLDLQYYIFRADTSGSLIAQALLRAADRGLRIRVLVDDGESIEGDERLFALAAHPSVQIRVFNPFDYRGHYRALRALDFILHKKRLDHRMHNKLIVADNALALIGGRNVGDQYFQISPDSQFGDDDVAVIGPMVQKLSAAYDEFWNNPLAIPIGGLDPKHASPAALAVFRATQPVREQTAFDTDLGKRLDAGEPLGGILSGHTALALATAQLVYDSPDKSRVVDGIIPGKLIYTAVQARVERVTKDLQIITPYFVPSPTQLDLLKNAHARGARVRVLTNSLEAAPDVIAHAGYSRFRPALLDAGVELFEIRARVDRSKGTGQPIKLSRHGNYALHAKLYVFDQESLFIGSMNFDQRSKSLNTEIGLLIDSPQLAAGAATRFNALTEPSTAYAVKWEDPSPAHGKRVVWETEVNGVPKELEDEPARSNWQRLKMHLFQWLPIDSEL